MKKSFYTRLFSCLLLGAYLLSSGVGSVVAAGQYLIADRLLGRVLRYSEGGSFLGTLIDDPSFGYGPASVVSAGGGLSSIALSPDQSRIYLTDRNANRVVVYSFNGSSATELFQFTSNGTSTITSPGGVLFSQDGSKIYISNLGLSPLPATDKVAQLTPNGVSAGPDLTGGPLQGRSGMAFDPNGNLLVGNFNLYGTEGGVLRFNSGTNQFESFIGPSAALTGVAALLVKDNYLYTASLDGSNITKYDATTGVPQWTIPPSATFISPGTVILSADGSSFLTSTLVSLQGINGYGNIQRFNSSGTLLGEFAANTTNANFPMPAGIDGPRPSVVFGFSETTGIVYTSVVPEPSSVVLGLFGVMTIVTQLRRVRRPVC